MSKIILGYVMMVLVGLLVGLTRYPEAPPSMLVFIAAIIFIVPLIYFLPTLILMTQGLPWGWTLFFNILIGWTTVGWAALMAISLMTCWQADSDARVMDSETRILSEIHKIKQT